MGRVGNLDAIPAGGVISRFRSQVQHSPHPASARVSRRHQLQVFAKARRHPGDGHGGTYRGASADERCSAPVWSVARDDPALFDLTNDSGPQDTFELTPRALDLHVFLSTVTETHRLGIGSFHSRTYLPTYARTSPPSRRGGLAAAHTPLLVDRMAIPPGLLSTGISVFRVDPQAGPADPLHTGDHPLRPDAP